MLTVQRKWKAEKVSLQFRLSSAIFPKPQFGAEYLTYVLWAVTPDGRTSNLGEILRDGVNGSLNVTTELQEFALVVTAEPYFAVSRPSNVVAMENVVRRDTNGGVEPVEAKYELFERGQYLHHQRKVLPVVGNHYRPISKRREKFHPVSKAGLRAF